MNFKSGKKVIVVWSQNLKKRFQDMQVAIQEKDKTIENLQTINEDLSSYVSTLENLAYKGKDISKVSKKSRTLKPFLSRAQSALWFATSFGLEVKSITVRETKPGESHSVTDRKTPEAPDCQENRQTSGFEALSIEDKSNVEKVLFLLDKFCVGDSFYFGL